MIQKADISCLSIRLGMFLLLISVSLSLSAQEDSTHMINDSIHTSSRTSFKLLPPDPFMERATYPLYPSDAYPYKPMNHPPEISLKKEIYLPYYTNPYPVFRLSNRRHHKTIPPRSFLRFRNTDKSTGNRTLQQRFSRLPTCFKSQTGITTERQCYENKYEPHQWTSIQYLGSLALSSFGSSYPQVLRLV